MLPEWSDDLIERWTTVSGTHCGNDSTIPAVENAEWRDASRLAPAQTRAALRGLLESTIAELEKALGTSATTQPTTQDAADQWAGEIAIVLSSFIQDVPRGDCSRLKRRERIS